MFSQMIHDAEMDVEIARVDMEKAREKLAQLRLALREKRAEGQGEGRFQMPNSNGLHQIPNSAPWNIRCDATTFIQATSKLTSRVP